MKLFRQELLDLGNLQPNGHDVGGLVLGPVPVGGRNDRAIRQDFDPRITAIPTFVVLLQKNPIIAGISRDKVLVTPDPSDPTVGRRAGVALTGDIPKRHKKSTVRQILGRMPIARKRVGKRLGMGPACHFVVAQKDMRIGFASILAEQHRDLLSVRR